MRIWWQGIFIGMIVGFYWARVIKLVFKQRRVTGRAANFLPPETLGRVLRIIWYPTIVLWIAVPFLTGFAPRLPTPLHLLATGRRYQVVAWLAVAAAAAALGATLVCWKRMGKSWRMGIDPSERTQLIFSGPYAYVRHPIYALSSWMMLASVVGVPSVLMIVIGLLHILFLQWEARREERYLLELHGASYQTYLTRVGRFIPRSLTPYTGS
jgi:protein-S-isoprenylcysteine O-methyltransferase Ste14